MTGFDSQVNSSYIARAIVHNMYHTDALQEVKYTRPEIVHTVLMHHEVGQCIVQIEVITNYTHALTYCFGSRH